MLRRRFVQEGVRLTPAHENGLVASFYEPPQPGPHPALMILGGSGGGIPESAAQLLASHGYAALAVGYFGMEGLPATLSLIQLEYFGRALEWLQAQRAVDGTKIGVLGGSRGGELALLLGATYPQITAAVAYAPSHVVWPGCCDTRSYAASAWSHNGEPLPFVPGTSDPTRLAKYAGGSPPLLLHRFLASLEDIVAVTRAAIPVERINGGVLLISGRDDQLWPSSQMADLVVARLQRHSFTHPYLHLSYEQAGHAVGTPYRPTTGLTRSVHPITKIAYPMGGTPAGYARAQADSWPQVLGFLETHLKRLGQQNRR
jgi:dienelactone hydrolase